MRYWHVRVGQFGRREFVRLWTGVESELVARAVEQDGLCMVRLDVVLVRVGWDVLVHGRVVEEVAVFLFS